MTFTIDPPASSTGSWWIDVQRYGRVASIEWRPGKGFGVAAPHGGYGEGVDVIGNDAVAAAEYVARVLQPYSGAIDLNGPAGSNVLEQQLVAALASHIDRVVGDIVHTTVEKLLLELRNQIGDVPVDVRRVEFELSRITEQVLSERKTETPRGVEGPTS
ncbi:MAG TPA: hypothetical protein VE974_07425 [Thermoanaerobaculia bacterium]|nr:hypothetical protein [Thermoanaerobaculia bacterium]